MHLSLVINLLYFYGAFLICCGVTAVIFIGMKAKTALISGGLAGSLSLLTAYLNSIHVCCMRETGIFLSFALFCVFAWRSTKTLQSIFPMIRENHPGLSGKGIAFLIISLMAVVSIFVFALQVVLYFAKTFGL